MALTIDIKGHGVIANCDALTNDTGGTGTGDWTEEGGGSMSVSPDVSLFGNTSIAGKYAGKSGFMQFDLGSGNELDFTFGGNAYAQLIFIWVNCSAFAALETLENFGLCVRISSSEPGTSNYADYLIAGSDGSNGWTGGWKLFVIDPDVTPTRSDGTVDKTAIRTLGIWIDNASSVRADTIWIDQIAVGEGIIVTAGSSTTGWKDIVDYCTDYANRAWGMFQEQEGIYYTYGQTYIGDYDDQTDDISFKDSGRIIQFGVSEYYDGIDRWRTSYREYKAGIKIADSALNSYDTDFEDGFLVGTDGGRAGSFLIGNTSITAELSIQNSRTGSQTKLYNTTIRGFSLATCISWINSAVSHLFYGGSVIGCGNTAFGNAVKIRNVLFAAVDGPGPSPGNNGSAILWADGMDIEKCRFIANVSGDSTAHGIRHSSAGEYDYKGLVFEGNDKDVHFTAATGDLIINNLAPTGGGLKSNAATDQTTGTGSVTFNSSFIHKLTGVKQYSEVTYTIKPTPYDSLTGLAFVAGSRVALDILADWTTNEFKGKLLVVSTAGANIGRYYVTGNNATEIFLSKEAAASQAVSCDIYGTFTVLDHTEDVPADGENEYIYNYASGTYVDLIIFHLDYKDIILEDVNLGELDTTIPIVQIPEEI
jgi:hypothetical protein